MEPGSSARGTPALLGALLTPRETLTDHYPCLRATSRGDTSQVDEGRFIYLFTGSPSALLHHWGKLIGLFSPHLLCLDCKLFWRLLNTAVLSISNSKGQLRALRSRKYKMEQLICNNWGIKYSSFLMTARDPPKSPPEGIFCILGSSGWDWQEEAR